MTTIVESEAAHLIGHTVSCAHTIFKSKSQQHCGTCSQCIDRRIAVLAAGQGNQDSETDYAVDVFIGPRKEGYERNIAVDYAHHALELRRMTEAEIAGTFNHLISRAVRGEPRQGESAQRLIEMHKRHSNVVAAVIEQQIREHSAQLYSGELDATSMLARIVGGDHLETSWKRYSDCIAQMLSLGLPRVCKSHKPKNENHLQELCDGILHAQQGDLVREFPYMRWSSSLTKPDFSDEAYCLWVELKYVRKREDIRPITEDIAADITKYGDNHRRTLFVVYDPLHLIVDEGGFSLHIRKRTELAVQFIR